MAAASGNFFSLFGHHSGLVVGHHQRLLISLYSLGWAGGGEGAAAVQDDLHVYLLPKLGTTAIVDCVNVQSTTARLKPDSLRQVNTCRKVK